MPGRDRHDAHVALGLRCGALRGLLRNSVDRDRRNQSIVNAENGPS